MDSLFTRWAAVDRALVVTFLFLIFILRRRAFADARVPLSLQLPHRQRHISFSYLISALLVMPSLYIFSIYVAKSRVMWSRALKRASVHTSLGFHYSKITSTDPARRADRQSSENSVRPSYRLGRSNGEQGRCFRAKDIVGDSARVVCQKCSIPA
jgi:hypothetical protein